MHKKPLSLPVAAALVGIVAPGVVAAQTNVEIYGSIDVAFSHRGDNIAPHVGSRTSIDSGTASGNRLGFRGTEDLGNGLKALFTLEAGFKADDGEHAQGGRLFGRQAYLGLTGGFGTVIAGRLYAPRYSLLSSLDPFGGASVGQFNNVLDDVTFYGTTLAVADVVRVDNAVAYVSPSLGGFNVTLAYATNAVAQEGGSAAPITGQTDNDGDAKTWAILPRYKNGPLDVGFSYQNIKVDEIVPDGPSAKVRQWSVGGAYDFNAVKLAAYYDQYKATHSAFDNSEKLESWLIGATIPFGKHAVRVSYTQSKFDDYTGDSDGKARQWALGYSYALSKRTNVFAIYSDISNDDAGGSDGGGDGNHKVHRHANAADAYHGYGSGYQNGFQVGLKHTF
ncbi:MAG: porin [Zoogloeaceae bacterium]|jgi:predicted porin|nr:porin [Zoogloeaceae bacterium]